MSVLTKGNDVSRTAELYPKVFFRPKYSLLLNALINVTIETSSRSKLTSFVGSCAMSIFFRIHNGAGCLVRNKEETLCCG